VAEVQKPASAPVASQPAAPASPSDTVTLNSAAQREPSSVDVDHDGDSR
jgi:hypothetical protein